MASVAEGQTNQTLTGDLQWVGANSANMPAVAQRGGGDAVFFGFVDGQLRGKCGADLARRRRRADRQPTPVGQMARSAYSVLDDDCPRQVTIPEAVNFSI